MTNQWIIIWLEIKKKPHLLELRFKGRALSNVHKLRSQLLEQREKIITDEEQDRLELVIQDCVYLLFHQQGWYQRIVWTEVVSTFSIVPAAIQLQEQSQAYRNSLNLHVTKQYMNCDLHDMLDKIM